MFYQALVFSMGWAKSQIPTCFDRFWPPPANPVKFFWLKMPSKCVPSIVLQVLSATRTSRGSLRPPKRPSKAKNGQNITFLAISGSVLSDFAVFLASPVKYEKNAAFGSHVALSVLQMYLEKRGKSTYKSATAAPSPLLLSFSTFKRPADVFFDGEVMAMVMIIVIVMVMGTGSVMVVVMVMVMVVVARSTLLLHPKKAENSSPSFFLPGIFQTFNKRAMMMISGTSQTNIVEQQQIIRHSDPTQEKNEIQLKRCAFCFKAITS